MNRRILLLRAAETGLVAVVAVVLPVTVHDPGVYLACAVPCLVAAVVVGYLDGRTRR